MAASKKKATNVVRKGRILLVYGLVAMLGLLVGVAAKSRAGEGDGEPDVEELVRRAFNRIAKDAVEDRDGGVSRGERRVQPLTPSPEPDAYDRADGGVDGGAPAGKPLPEFDPEGGAGQKVLLVEITEDIEMGLSAHIERVVNSNRDARALIIELNTPGGRVDAASKIRDALLQVPETMKTVAFIHPRAASAGAFISLACDYIFIADGGTIGAATPIDVSGGSAEPVGEKFVSFFRAEMASTARAKGRRGDIAEAMVDADVEIEGISPAGKLLTLDAAGALRLGIADGKANSLDEVLEKMSLDKARLEGFEMNWAERLAQILTSPILSGILMSIGMLGILIELYQPGFGLPGVVGIACLVMFFSGHLVVHLAGWEEVLLFVVGVALIIVEVYVSPGFGVAGVLGVLIILAALVLSLSSMPLDISFDTGILTRALFRVLVSLIVVVVLFAVALFLMPKLGIKSKLVLQTAIDGTAAGGVEGEVVRELVASGESGVAESYLRPAGIARFGNKRVDVLSEGDFVERGENVVVVRTEGNRVIVKKET